MSNHNHRSKPITSTIYALISGIILIIAAFIIIEAIPMWISAGLS